MKGLRGVEMSGLNESDSVAAEIRANRQSVFCAVGASSCGVEPFAKSVSGGLSLVSYMP